MEQARFFRVTCASLALQLVALPALAQTPTPTPETGATHPVEQTPPQPAAPAHASSGQPMNVTGEFGRGVTLRTADERFSLNIRGRMQARFTLAERPVEPQTEFQIRRARLVLQGNLFGRDQQYYIQLGFSNLDTEPDLRLPLRDAYFTWSRFRDVSVRVGQMKVPFGRQRVVSSSAQQMVDRSLAVGEFNLDRDVGLVLFSKDLFGLGNRLGYQLGVFGGDGRNRLSDVFGLLWVARVQITPFGEFDDLVEADLQRLPRPRLAVGFGAAYNQNSRRARSTFSDTYQQSFDQLHLGADLTFKLAGFSLALEWLWRRANEDSHVVTSSGASVTEYARSGYGYHVQAGYLFNEHFEVSARWAQVIPFSGSDPRLHLTRELGAGASWYFAQHNLKLQADWFNVFHEEFSDGQHQARVQLQVYF